MVNIQVQRWTISYSNVQRSTFKSNAGQFRTATSYRPALTCSHPCLSPDTAQENNHQITELYLCACMTHSHPRPSYYAAKNTPPSHYWSTIVSFGVHGVGSLYQSELVNQTIVNKFLSEQRASVSGKSNRCASLQVSVSNPSVQRHEI